jgi:GNAT superfamily N-acetyltransferase
MNAAADIVIRPLTPELVGDYLAFFDHVAFADHPEWQFCYCNFLHHDHAQSKFSATKADDNRAAVKQRICARAMHGHLAFDGERAIGWCQAAPRLVLPALRDEPDPEGVAAQTGSIVCFVIAKDYRRKGLARRLLNAACDGFRAQGLGYAEAYPRDGLTGDGENHFGPLAMYLGAGFERLRVDGATIVVRRKL